MRHTRYPRTKERSWKEVASQLRHHLHRRSGHGDLSNQTKVPGSASGASARLVAASREMTLLNVLHGPNDSLAFWAVALGFLAGNTHKYGLSSVEYAVCLNKISVRL